VTGKDARDVAAYVAAVAGQPGEDAGVLALAGRPEVSDKPIVAEDGQAEIAADPTGALAYVARFIEAEGGQITLNMPNPSPVEHNIAIKGGGVDEKGPVVPKGGTSEVSADLQPGKFVFYCSVPGHEEGGMRGELTVE
jgi:plastocyanin